MSEAALYRELTAWLDFPPPAFQVRILGKLYDCYRKPSGGYRTFPTDVSAGRIVNR